jgi:vancomycin resistance protein YoaR
MVKYIVEYINLNIVPKGNEIMNKALKFIFASISCIFLLSGCAEKGALPKGSVAGGVDVGGMSASEAVSALENVSIDPIDSADINTDIYTLSFTAEEVGAKYNAEKTVENISGVKKNFWGKIVSNFKKTNYDMAVDIDENMLDSAISNKLYGVERDVTQFSYELTDTGIRITNGLSGAHLDREKTAEELSRLFGEDKENREVGNVEIDKTYPDEVDNDAFLSQFNSEAKEACYVQYPDGSIQVAEGQTGIVIDKSYAASIMQSHTQEGENYLIPCEIVFPKYTKEYLEQSLFADTLATYSSSFASSAQNRIDNITLAASKINNIVLMPGETFSFNDALGERTEANGYKVAHAYSSGEVVDQVGGGICQVSSTLYNTVLLSNLAITERRNHQMTVSYVPLGRDATVNWGTQDFRFTNDTYFPVKVSAYTSGKNVVVSIIGTKPDKTLKVEIETETISTIEPTIKTENDPTMLVGETKLVKSGSNGYVVDAYRVVYSEGKEISREKLKRSTYNPSSGLKKVGTKAQTEPTNAEDAGL